MRMSNTYVNVALGLVGLTGALTAAGCSPRGDSVVAGSVVRAETAAGPDSPVTRVTTVVPQRVTIKRTTREPGQTEAAESTPVRAKISGYVRGLTLDIGDRVKQGQVLAELDVPEFEAELQQKQALVAQAEADRKQSEALMQVAEAAVVSAEAKVAAVQAGMRRTEADVARWQAEFARTQQLLRESAITGALVDETRSKFEAAQAARDEIRAQVKSAEAGRTQAVAEREKARADIGAAVARFEVARSDVRRVDAMLKYSKVEAPFDGVITRRNVDTGHLTLPGGGSEPLFVVARFDLVTISVGVPEADAPFVNPGDPAQIRLAALDGKTFEGKVARTAWALDSETRTLRVEIDLPNSDDAIHPGLYAYATITLEEHPNALTVPATAIVKEADQTFCVAVVDGRAKRLPVRVGLTEDKRTEVVSGLAGGERIVEANAGSLVDGQRVESSKPKS